MPFQRMPRKLIKGLMMLVGLGFAVAMIGGPYYRAHQTAEKQRIQEDRRQQTEAAAQGDRKPAKMVREEIRYTIRILTDDIPGTVERFNAAASSFGVTGDRLTADRPAQIDVPRTHYSGFLQQLQKLGKLRVARQRFNTDTPSDSPVPFTIKVEAKESNGQASKP